MTEPASFANDNLGKQRLFDLWAPVYDCLLPSVFYQAIHQRLLQYVTLPEHAYILEIGCGTGKLLQRLANQQLDLVGVGLDFSTAMLQQARLAAGSSERLTFIQGSSDQLAFHRDQFDAVFCSMSFLHYPKPVQVFQEVARVLKPGGQFFLADIAPSKWTTQQQVILPLSPGGLRFYSAASRQALAQQAQLHCERHVHLLGPVMLSQFHLPQ